MIKAGVEGQPVCLFLEDHQLMDSGFLECINSLLSGGEVHLVIITASLQCLQYEHRSVYALTAKF